jgi:hypothetical protein
MLQLAGSMYLSGIEVNAGEFHFRFLADAAEVEPDELCLALLGSSRAVCGAAAFCWRCWSA